MSRGREVSGSISSRRGYEIRGMMRTIIGISILVLLLSCIYVYIVFEEIVSSGSNRCKTICMYIKWTDV